MPSVAPEGDFSVNACIFFPHMYIVAITGKKLLQCLEELRRGLSRLSHNPSFRSGGT